MKSQSKSTTFILTIYIVLFYSIWAVFEFVFKGAITEAVQNPIIGQIIKTGLIKNLVWTFPAALLIHYNRDKVFISLKEMFTAKVNWKRYLPIFVFFTVYIIAGFFIHKGTLNISETFHADELISLLFVGLTEEIVFRGWLLNVTYREDHKYRCIILNSLMFLAIHFPRWIYEDTFIASFISFGFIEVILLSIIFSQTFIKSRNILVPIALHMYWDLLIFILY